MDNGLLMAKRLREVVLDGKWIANTNYKDQLSQTTWEEANQKISSFNSIGLLTYHVNYYIKGVLNVLKGGPLEIKDKYSFDMAPLQNSEEWHSLQEELYANTESFALALESMTDEEIEAPFIVEKYGTYYRNLEGMIEHGYYHLGQIVLLKKWIKSQKEDI